MGRGRRCGRRCGNVASILELDDYLAQEYKVFSHAPSVRPFLSEPLSPLAFSR